MERSNKFFYNLRALAAVILSFILLISGLPTFMVQAKNVGSATATYTNPHSTNATEGATYVNYGSKKPNSTYHQKHTSWYPKYYDNAKFTGNNGKTKGSFFCINPSDTVGGNYNVWQLTDKKGKYLGLPSNQKYFASQPSDHAGLSIEKQVQVLRILLMFTENDKYDSAKYLASQILVWETVVGERDKNFKHVAPPSNRTPVKNYGKGATHASGWETQYSNIEKKVQQFIQDYGLDGTGGKKSLPSFADTTQTVDMDAGGSSASISLTDSNNVLSNYKVSKQDNGVNAKIDGNQLNISASDLSDGQTKSVTLESTGVTSNGIAYLLYPKSGSHQAGVITVPSPMTTTVKLKVKEKEAGDPFSLTIEKQTADGSQADLSGTTFNMKWYKSGTASGTPDGEYSLPVVKNESNGKYTVSLDDATTISGEDLPISSDVSADSQTAAQYSFPDNSLIVISEETPPSGFEDTPEWTVTSGTGATVSGDSVQIKITKNSDNSVQSVYLTAKDKKTPKSGISTNLLTSSGDTEVNANEHSTIDLVDTVTIDEDSTGIDGASGTLVGTIYDMSTGEKLGTQTQSITNAKAGASYTQKFTANISKYANSGDGTTIYCDEELTLNNVENGTYKHEGKSDADQQVNVVSTPIIDEPTMETTLSDNSGTTNTINRDSKTQLKDSIQVSGISENAKATNAKLTSELIGPNGKIKTQSQDLGSLTNTTYSVTFEPFDSTDTTKYPDGQYVYANETITYTNSKGETKTISEEGKEKPSQRVTFSPNPIPTIGTTLTDSTKQNKKGIIPSDGKMTLIDSVHYNKLTSGQSYTLEGTLMDKSTGEALKDASGNSITGTATFTASGESGTQDIKFDFTISSSFSNPIVAFETLKDNSGKEIAVHKDINDIDQTFTPGKRPETPVISTSVKSKDTGDRIASSLDKVNLVDTVTYSGLEANTKYVMQGTLMHRSTGTAIQQNGKDLTNTIEFTSSSSGSGTVDVPFIFSAKEIQLKGQSLNLAGQDIVVFETLYKSDKTTVVAKHRDRNDTKQIVHFPKGHTNARDAETLTQNSNAGKKVTIKDVVTYENLIPGHTYTMTGTAYRQDTGKPLTDNGKVVSNTISFTPTSANGSVVVPVTFDASLLQGKTIVMFEDCKYNGYSVFVHADIHDKQQSIYVPELHTVAVNKKDGSNKLGVGNCKISDKVSYKNLIVGQEYTIEGVLMDKSTGKPITIDGKQVTGSATFTAEQETGYQVVDFKVDTSKISAKHIVVFETLYTGNHKVVGSHKDINDTDQTVTVVPNTPTGSFPIVPVAIAAGAVILGAGLYFIFRKKKHTHTTD